MRSKKILIKLGLILFLFGNILLLPNISLAVDNVNETKFTPQVSIPDSEFQQGTAVNVGKISGTKVTSDLIGRYVIAFYKWGLSIGGVLAVLMLMAGGLIWLTSAGDSGKIGDAKKMISGSLLGTLLLVGAYFFLNTINPNLINMPAITIDAVQKKSIQKLTEDAADGIIDNKDMLPEDTVIKWICMNSTSQTCENTNPPTINLDLTMCQEKLGDHQTCGYGLIWCCGLSETSQKEVVDLCKDKDNGDECKLTITSVEGSGYCNNDVCVPCKKLNETCSGRLKNYECVGESGLCGKPTDGTNDCNCNISGDCICDDTWK